MFQLKVAQLSAMTVTRKRCRYLLGKSRLNSYGEAGSMRPTLAIARTVLGYHRFPP